MYEQAEVVAKLKALRQIGMGQPLRTVAMTLLGCGISTRCIELFTPSRITPRFFANSGYGGSRHRSRENALD